MFSLVATGVLAALLVLSLAVFTGPGGLRRGRTAVFAAAAGIAFPLGWVLRYLHDERPHHRRVHHHA